MSEPDNAQEPQQEEGGLGLLAGVGQGVPTDPGPQNQPDGAGQEGQGQENGNAENLVFGKYKDLSAAEKGYTELRASYNKLLQEGTAAQRDEAGMPQQPEDYLAAGNWDAEALAKEADTDASVFSADQPAILPLIKLAYALNEVPAADRPKELVKGLVEIAPSLTEVPQTEEQMAALQEAKIAELGPDWKNVYGPTADFAGQLRKSLSQSPDLQEALDEMMDEPAYIKVFKAALDTVNAVNARPMQQAKGAVEDNKGHAYWVAQAGTEKYAEDEHYRELVDGKILSYNQAEMMGGGMA